MSKTTPEEAKALAEKHGICLLLEDSGYKQLAALIDEVRGVDAEPVGTVTITKGVGVFEKIQFQLIRGLPAGKHQIYTRPAPSQPAAPVPSSVQEIMPLVNAYVRACGEFLISGEDGAEEALKPLQATLTALVDDNHRLKFELDGVRAMRGPLTEAEVTAIHSLPYVRACLMEYRHWPVDETASAVVKAIAVQISALAASPPTNGIEPEQGEVK